ncbi:MAG: SGNH/GDSL hydrolase family protein [Clostridia bacterium]|nr:SGNH/GDSL hydrolase family protein [Clostridia bacterium]
MNNVMDNLKKIAKAVLFIALFVVLYTGSREVLRNKSESEALGKIFTMPNESYSVVLAGPSHIQYGVHPSVLKSEYNISACNTATAAQSMPTTYYVVKEMIERHSPEIVAVDLFCMFYPEVYFTPTRFHQAIDNFPIGKNKAEAILDLAEVSKSEFFLNYMLYHGRWKSLTRTDYTVTKEYDETSQVLYVTTPFENDFVPLDKAIKNEVPEVPLQYLKKIVDLCKETNTELILTVIPYRADVDNNDVTGAYQQSIYNKIEEYAQDWGVEYINLLYHLDDMGFDFQTDMAEFSHLNESGSMKVSKYFGKILKDRLEN